MKEHAAEVKYRLWSFGKSAGEVLRDPLQVVTLSALCIVNRPYRSKGTEADRWLSERMEELDRDFYERRGRLSKEENERRFSEKMRDLFREREERYESGSYPYDAGYRRRRGRR